MSTLPKTLQEARAMGFEEAPLEDFNRALENNSGVSALAEKVDCRTAPEGTVCTYIPCFEGWEYISTCFNRECNPGLRRRC
jgi:hypothetical protein